MAYSFGDSFDLYANGGDMAFGYWDSVGGGGGGFGAGRFANSRGWSYGFNLNLVKASNVNDAVHHFVFSQSVASVLSAGTAKGFYASLYDGATAQCTVAFQQDGSLQLLAGNQSGAVLSTWAGAIGLQNTWYAFEVEVVIHPTAGSFTIRKNGNPVADFTQGGLNTRATANNYANKIQIGGGSNTMVGTVDDFFWRSDASAVAWMGDIRCYTRMPVNDVQAQFTPVGTRTQTNAGGINGACTANKVIYSSYVLASGGTVGTVTILTASTAYTGNLKCAIYNDNGSNAPGTLLATATNTVNNPPTGLPASFTFSPGLAVAVGQKIWVALAMDTSGSSGNLSITSASTGWQGSTTYASFPPASPGALVAFSSNGGSLVITLINSSCVNEAQQDAFTTYVYDNNPGDADFYGIASISSTPAVVFGTVIRAFMTKSDAGTRTSTVQLKSGATTVAAPTVVLTTSSWLWAWRMDLTDPATGAAWTPGAVNTAQIGPKVIA